ncbi:MAG: prenyltransferase/squalene oxidase repeat-containing protein [Dehalococcoidia bacterium]
MKRWILVSAAALAVMPLLGAEAASTSEAIASGATYIKSLQTADGAYGSESLSQNMDAVFAVRAAGFDPAKDKFGGVGPAEFLAANIDQVTNSAIAAKAALVAKALGLDPHAVGGLDLITTAEAGFDSATGLYGEDAFSQSISMIGLACTGNEVTKSASEALLAMQLDDSHGWGFGGFPDPDTTAIAIQALLATGSGADLGPIVEALAFLKESQGEDGGWGFDPAASNASSTAYVVQALYAAGEDPESAEYTVDGVTPIEFLLSQQQPDGSFLGFDPAYSTNQVLPALAGRTFCNAADTPIVNVRTEPTATPSAIPSSPTATPSVVPGPPSTGNATPHVGGGGAGVLFGGALIVLAVGFGLAAAARRGG